jgi:hypothetical protein
VGTEKDVLSLGFARLNVGKRSVQVLRHVVIEDLGDVIGRVGMADVDLTWAVDLRGVFVTMKHAARVMVVDGGLTAIGGDSPFALGQVRRAGCLPRGGPPQLTRGPSPPVHHHRRRH